MSRKIWLALDKALSESPRVVVTESAFRMALDRDTVRKKTKDNRLEVTKANISKANVCPYRGKEIPNHEQLGLDPDRVYNLLRDPEELRKAADSSNGVQLLIKHVPVNADDHRPNETVGSLGTDAEFDGTYLTNSIFVNAQHAIDGIESGKQKQLSAGYHYTPDMTPGNFNGTAYDGVMREIVFNHVALVEDGRAGPDVVVGDEALKGDDTMKKATRFAALMLSTTASVIAPALAMDSKATLSRDVFAGLTPKNFKDARAGLLANVRTAIDGKLRKGIALDATMEDLGKAIDAFGGGNLEEEVVEAQDLDTEVDPMEVAAPAQSESTYDAEPLKAFLKEKGMDDASIMKACDMLPKAKIGADADETDEEKSAREKKEEEAKKQAADNEEKMKGMVSKTAMDEAIKTAVTSVRETERGIRTALVEVKPYVGELPSDMAFDSGADVRRHALKMLGVAGYDKLHADALAPVLAAQPRKDAKRAAEPKIAQDAATLSAASKIAPGIDNITSV